MFYDNQVEAIENYISRIQTNLIKQLESESWATTSVPGVSVPLSDSARYFKMVSNELTENLNRILTTEVYFDIIV